MASHKSDKILRAENKNNLSAGKTTFDSASPVSSIGLPYIEGLSVIIYVDFMNIQFLGIFII